MRLLRVGSDGHERPCVLNGRRRARDISSLVRDISPSTIQGLVARLDHVDLDTLPLIPLDGARIGPPMAQPRNIYCIGLNYSDHAAEAGMDIPLEPILFNKSSGTYEICQKVGDAVIRRHVFPA